VGMRPPPEVGSGRPNVAEGLGEPLHGNVVWSTVIDDNGEYWYGMYDAYLTKGWPRRCSFTRDDQL
jgi:hypothetical protein